MKSLEIIACTPADAEDVADIAVRAYRDYYLYLWNDGASWYIYRSFNPGRIEEEMRDANAAYFFLKENGVMIGFMKLNLDQPLTGFTNKKAMELERLYILKSASRRGFGRQALEFCFELARQRKREILWLKTMDSSEALNFYARLGFRECGHFQLDFELMIPEFRGMKILMKEIV